MRLTAPLSPPKVRTRRLQVNPYLAGVTQGCIKLTIPLKPGRGVSPHRPCLGGSGRLGAASLPELDAALGVTAFALRRAGEFSTVPHPQT